MIEEEINGKKVKRTEGNRTEDSVRMLVLEDTTEGARLVTKWVELDEPTKQYQEEKAYERKLEQKQKEIERRIKFVEQKRKLEELEKLEKELNSEINLSSPKVKKAK